MFNVKRLIFRMKFHRHCIPDTLASEYSEYNPNYIGELVVSWVELLVPGLGASCTRARSFLYQGPELLVPGLGASWYQGSELLVPGLGASCTGTRSFWYQGSELLVPGLGVSGTGARALYGAYRCFFVAAHTLPPHKPKTTMFNFRFKCHRDCVQKESASCGLSEEIVEIVRRNIFEGNCLKKPCTGTQFYMDLNLKLYSQLFSNVLQAVINPASLACFGS